MDKILKVNPLGREIGVADMVFSEAFKDVVTIEVQNLIKERRESLWAGDNAESFQSGSLETYIGLTLAVRGYLKTVKDTKETPEDIASVLTDSLQEIIYIEARKEGRL